LPPAQEQFQKKGVSGFPSGIAQKQRDRAVCRFRETVNRSRDLPALLHRFGCLQKQ
jgi:hypothetical protein